MIDLNRVAASSLWIMGCAIGLATLSYASWEASRDHVKMHHYLGQSLHRGCLYLAGGLICLGLAVTASSWWEIAIWLVLGLMVLVQIVVLTIKNKTLC
jgi:hypothetical protein